MCLGGHCGGDREGEWTVGSNEGEWPRQRAGRGNQAKLAKREFVWAEMGSHQKVLSECWHVMALLFLICSVCCVERSLKGVRGKSVRTGGNPGVQLRDEASVADLSRCSQANQSHCT